MAVADSVSSRASPPYVYRMFRVFVIVLTALAIAVPAAQAQNAPPGNSGIDEYVEAVPSTSGSKPTNQASGKDGKVLTSTQQKALEAQGPDGAAAAALAQRFGTPGTGKAHEQQSAGTKKDDGADKSTGGATGDDSNDSRGPGGSGSSVASSLSKAVLPGSDSGGLGPALPIILVAITAAGVGVVVLRRFRAN